MNLFRIASLRIYYEDRNCTYNENCCALVQPLLPCKSNKYYIFCEGVFSLKFPAGNALAPYYHLWPAPLYSIFPHYLIKGTIFAKTLLNLKCVFWFSLQHFSETFLILRRTERDMIINVYWSSCKVPIILVRFKWNLSFLARFSNNTQISNFMIICPVEAELFRANGQTRGWTDRLDEANSRFSEFCERV